MEQFLVLILMFGAFYYLVLRPRRSRERTRPDLLGSLQFGDEVVTKDGIHGVVAEVEDAVVWLEVAPDVELKISRDAVAGRTQGSPVDDEAGEAGDDDGIDGLTLAVAALIKSVALPSGVGSPEWTKACALLVVLSDGDMDPLDASAVLMAATPKIGHVAASLMPQEIRLAVLRFGAEIALADGSMSFEEMDALRALCSTLQLPFDVLDTLLLTMVEPTDETEEALRILGLDSDATTAEIRQAYRSLILRWHPDKAAEPDRAEATRRSSEINAAYDCLMALGTTSEQKR